MGRSRRSAAARKARKAAKASGKDRGIRAAAPGAIAGMFVAAVVCLGVTVLISVLCARYELDCVRHPPVDGSVVEMTAAPVRCTVKTHLWWGMTFDERTLDGVIGAEARSRHVRAKGAGRSFTFTDIVLSGTNGDTMMVPDHSELVDGVPNLKAFLASRMPLFNVSTQYDPWPLIASGVFLLVGVLSVWNLFLAFVRAAVRLLDRA